MSSAEMETLRAGLAVRGTKALLVIRHDAIVGEWHAPDQAADQPHHTASLAKALVGGLSLAVVLSDGRLGLADPASRFIPQWSLLRERIMRPIGLPDAEWSAGCGETIHVGGLPLVASWGGGAYTARAAARVGRLLLRQGDWDGQRMHSAEAVLVRFWGALAKVAPGPKSFHEACAQFLFEPLMAAITDRSPKPLTRVTVDRGRWLVNGRPTNPGSAAEGLLMNVRMVNAVFEDRRRPGFDPEANADRFMARIPDYAAAGVNAFTLCLQGGMPGYEGAVNSAFEADGGLRPAYLARVERVIRACDARGLAVILGLFYQRQSQVLRDEAAVRAGVVNAAGWVRDRGFQNVLLEIANEFPHGGFVHGIIRDSKGQAGLIRLAKATAPGLLVSASGCGDGAVPGEVAEAADFLLPHWNDTEVGQIPARIGMLKRYGKPVVCNEDDKTGAEAVEALRACVANGASYGLMLKERNQTFPFRFDGPADDPVFYAALRALTTPASGPQRTP